MAQNVKVPPLEEAPATAVGSAPQSVFDFDFPFWTKADIKPVVDGVEVETDAFTVEGYYVQNGEVVEGGYGSGTVTLNTPVSNCTVIIDRFVEPVRESQFSRAAPLGMPALNSDLNKQVARLQDIVRRAVLTVPGSTGPSPQDVIDAAAAVANKLNASLPATSPAVDASPYSANLILDKPHIPERFGATSAMIDGLADASGVFQKMLDASQQDERDKMKPLDLGSCRFVLDAPGVIEMGNYGGSGLTILGGGNNVTKLIADTENSEGILKIVRSHNMERVTVSGVSFISRLLQQTDNVVMNGMNPGYTTADLTKHNGVALWIAGPTPAGGGIYGLEDDTAVIVERCSWHGEGDNSSETLFNGVWKRALEIDGAWFAIVQNNHFAGLGDFNSDMMFLENINEHAVLLNHCYAPEFAGNKINGTWTTGFHLRGREAGADISAKFNQRWEGGRVRHNIFGGFSRDAIVLSHDFGLGSLQAPGFQILDNHINFRRFGVTINGHRQIESTSNEFYAANTPSPTGEDLPAGVYLRDCGDFDSVNDAFLELGWYDDDDHAFVCYRLDEKVQGFKSSAARFNCAGIGVRVGEDGSAPAEGDLAMTTRSVQVVDAAIGGRRAFNLWTDPFKEYVDQSGKGVVYWEGTEQDATGDRKRIVSNLVDATNTLSSPIVAIDRDRADYATNTTPKLGYETQRFRNSAGDWKDAMIVEGVVEDNTAGSLKTGFKLWAYLAGALTQIISVSGSLGQMAFGIGQVIHNSATALNNNRPRYELSRARPDYASVSNGKLGEYSFAGLNSAGTKILTGGIAHEFTSNTAESETTRQILYTRDGGAVETPLVLTGRYAEMLSPRFGGKNISAATRSNWDGYFQWQDAAGNTVKVPYYL